MQAEAGGGGGGEGGGGAAAADGGVEVEPIKGSSGGTSFPPITPMKSGPPPPPSDEAANPARRAKPVEGGETGGGGGGKGGGGGDIAEEGEDGSGMKDLELSLIEADAALRDLEAADKDRDGKKLTSSSSSPSKPWVYRSIIKPISFESSKLILTASRHSLEKKALKSNHEFYRNRVHGRVREQSHIPHIRWPPPQPDDGNVLDTSGFEVGWRTGVGHTDCWNHAILNRKAAVSPPLPDF
jgi:hypothetical protein